jgi:hypothetical protein
MGWINLIWRFFDESMGTITIESMLKSELGDVCARRAKRRKRWKSKWIQEIMDYALFV